MTAKNYCLLRYPDAKVKKHQSGFKRGVEYRLISKLLSTQIIGTSELSAWVILRKEIETTK
jgi:hypothetical protein